jgi:hypothetical protein
VRSYSGTTPGGHALSPTGRLPSVVRRHAEPGEDVLQPPAGNACTLAPAGFGLIPFRSPLLGESRLISFPRGTEMFQFPRLPSRPYVFRPGWRRITGARLPHSGIRGSTPVQQLTAAYRSRPRPSSTPGTKASTVCPSYLDGDRSVRGRGRHGAVILSFCLANLCGFQGPGRAQPPRDARRPVSQNSTARAARVSARLRHRLGRR